MTTKIPIAGYMEVGVLPVWGYSAMQTGVHFSWAYSYVFCSEKTMIVVGRLLCIKRKINIHFTEIMSVKKIRIFPFLGHCMRINLTLGRYIDIQIFSKRDYFKLLTLLNNAVNPES